MLSSFPLSPHLSILLPFPRWASPTNWPNLPPFLPPLPSRLGHPSPSRARSPPGLRPSNAATHSLPCSLSLTGGPCLSSHSLLEGQRIHGAQLIASNSPDTAWSRIDITGAPHGHRVSAWAPCADAIAMAEHMEHATNYLFANFLCRCRCCRYAEPITIDASSRAAPPYRQKSPWQSYAAPPYRGCSPAINSLPWPAGDLAPSSSLHRGRRRHCAVLCALPFFPFGQPLPLLPPLSAISPCSRRCIPPAQPSSSRPHLDPLLCLGLLLRVCLH